MPEIIVDCRQCGRTLRVPEDMLGRPVKCPVCGLTFSVPAGAPEPSPVSPASEAAQAPIPSHLPSPEDYGAPQDEFGEAQPLRDPDRAGALLTLPAILLLMVGVLGFLANVIEAVFVATRLRFPEPPPAHPPHDPMEQLQWMAQGGTGPMLLVIAAIFAIVSLLVIVGAVQMLRRRTYALAVAGSVLAMVNVNGLCCIPGLPAGIWALVALSTREGRSAFH
jgi:hypothetical protein